MSGEAHVITKTQVLQNLGFGDWVLGRYSGDYKPDDLCAVWFVGFLNWARSTLLK